MVKVKASSPKEKEITIKMNPTEAMDLVDSLKCIVSPSEVVLDVINGIYAEV